MAKFFHSLLGARVPVVSEIYPAPYFYFTDVTFQLPSPTCTIRAYFMLKSPRPLCYTEKKYRRATGLAANCQFLPMPREAKIQI